MTKRQGVVSGATAAVLVAALAVGAWWVLRSLGAFGEPGRSEQVIARVPEGMMAPAGAETA